MDDLTMPPVPEEEEKDYYTILKGRFKAVETDTYGLFIIYLNESEQKVENATAIASHYSSLFDNDPHIPWYEFEENIITTKWKGEILGNVSYELQSYLESSLEMDRGYELFQFVKNLEQMKIESLLQSILMKPLSDRNIIIETDSEFVSRETMKSTRDERDIRKTEGIIASEAGQAAGQTGTDRDILDVDLVLAPVSGTPLLELKEGDIVMVKIKDKSTKGNYYIDLLGAKVDGDVIPTPAVVIDISKDNDGAYVVLCKLDEDVLGKAVEPEPVKIKRYDEFLASSQIFESVPTPYSPNRSRYFILFISITGGLLFVLLLLFIIFYFYNFF